MTNSSSQRLNISDYLKISTSENGIHFSRKRPTVQVIVLSAMFISGCSSSSNSQPSGDEIAADDTTTTSTEFTPDAPNNSAPNESPADSTDLDTVEVEIEQTIPQEGNDVQSTPADVFIIDESNALDIFRETVAVINEEQISDFIDIYTSELELPTRTFFVTNTTDDIVFSETFMPESTYLLEEVFDSGDVTAVTVGDNYTCASGGSVQIFEGMFPSSDALFVDCVVSEAIYNGVTGTRNTFRGSISSVPYIDFTRLASNGEMVTLSGNAFGGNTAFFSIDRLDGWSDVEFLQSNAGEEFQLSQFNIRRTTVNTETGTANGGAFVDGEFIGFNTYRLEETIVGSFTVFAPWTDASQGLSVSVDLEYNDDVLLAIRDPDLADDVIAAITDPDFEFPQRDPVQPFNWEFGNVTITASDGSTMVITPSETETGAFELALSNGTVIGPLPWVDEFFIKP